MNTKNYTFRKTLLAAGIAASLGLSQTALAEEASSPLDISVGLTQALTLSCTDLDFGDLRIDTATYNAETQIEVAPNSAISFATGSNVTGVTLGDGTAAECTVSGSGAANDQTITVSINGVALDGVNTASPGGALNISSAVTPLVIADFPTVNTFRFDGDTIDGDGNATINIGATLFLGDTIVPSNLGTYSASFTVSIEDEFGNN